MSREAANKELFYMEMAKLLGAGFDIRKAAGVMEKQRLPEVQGALLGNLKAGLEHGDTIAGAFGRDVKNVGALEKSMMEAGERGGRLAETFGHLAGYFRMVARARREVIRGMMYPLIMLHLGVFVATVPLAMLMGEPEDGSVAVGFFKAMLILYAGVGIGFLAVRRMAARAPTDARADRLLNRIPWVGKARRNMAFARFCKVFHACLMAGIPMRETVRVATEAGRSGELLEAGRKIEKVAVEGTALGPAFLGEAIFPDEFSRSYANGEEAGTLDKDMESWSIVFQENAETAVRRAAVMVPKFFYFVIMAYVAWKIVAFFTGYYGALDGIGD